MLYEVIIKGANEGEEIHFGAEESDKSVINSVEIKIDTINDNATSRSNAILPKIILKGDITADNEKLKDNIIKLFTWSISENSDDWYRDIEIVIKKSLEEPIRTFTFPKMFVVDYIENYITDNAQRDNAQRDTRTHFELFLTQQINNLSKIDTY